MTFEKFEEQFNDLSFGEQLAIYNEYCAEVNSEDSIYNFDDEFFEVFFSSKADAVRSAVFGDINYSDEYIKFNGYGNLESLSKYGVEELFEDNLEDIFEHESCWRDYIEEEDEDEEEEED